MRDTKLLIPFEYNNFLYIKKKLKNGEKNMELFIAELKSDM